jgi:hypothetical protein
VVELIGGAAVRLIRAPPGMCSNKDAIEMTKFPHSRNGRGSDNNTCAPIDDEIPIRQRKVRVTGIGAILTIAGFGSLLLMLMNAHFVLLAWADPMQPAFGIVVGTAGVIVLIAGVVRERQAAPPAAQPGEAS